MAPITLLCPCTASVPHIVGILLPSKLSSIDAWYIASAKLTQSLGVACLSLLGKAPPPFKYEPKPYLRISSTVISRISGWIICATFCSSVIVASKDATFSSISASALTAISSFGQMPIFVDATAS